VEGPFRPEQVRKMLLIRRNGIGDMICALPLIRNIRAAWPQVQLDMLASEKNCCVLDNLDLVNTIYPYRRGRGLHRNHYINLPYLLKPIQEKNYDLVIAIKGGFSSLLAVIAYVTRVPWRLGYVPSRGHPLDFCFNLKVELPKEREHQVESCLRFLEPLGIRKTSCDLSLGLMPPHKRYTEKMLAEAAVRPGEFFVFNASSRRIESRWTVDGIVKTAVELNQRFRLPMILCGIPEDRGILRDVQRLGGRNIRVLVEPPTIHHFAALVKQARFLMSGDGGPMHVAAAVKTPAFILFSATDPRIWRPYGIPFEFIQKSRFVADITADEVVEKIVTWLPTLPPQR
jgi:ADP-heptose:LPS heptosyltransferase